MDQSGNNQLLLRASQSGPPGYNGYTGQHAAADRMRELLARTVQDHIVEERSTVAALQDIRQRLNDLDDASAAGIAASLDGLAASLGTLDSKLTARLERLDERLDDQYDRVRTLESTLKEQPVSLEEAVARGVETSGADIMARIASLEDTVLTLAEALLRPAIRRLAGQSFRIISRTDACSASAAHCSCPVYARSIAARGLARDVKGHPVDRPPRSLNVVRAPSRIPQ
jgi:hypothetical protein